MEEARFIFQSLRGIEEIINGSKFSLDSNFLKLDYWVMVSLFNLFCDRKLITDNLYSPDDPPHISMIVEKRVFFSGIKFRYGSCVPDPFLNEISEGAYKRESLLDLGVLDKNLLEKALKKLQSFWFEKLRDYDEGIFEFLRLSVKELQTVNPIKSVDSFKLLLITPPGDPISEKIFEELLSKGFILKVSNKERLVRRYDYGYTVKNVCYGQEVEQFFVLVMDDISYKKPLLLPKVSLETLESDNEKKIEIMSVFNKGNEFYVVLGSKSQYYLNLDLKNKEVVEVKPTSVSLDEMKREEFKGIKLELSGDILPDLSSLLKYFVLERNFIFVFKSEEGGVAVLRISHSKKYNSFSAFVQFVYPSKLYQVVERLKTKKKVPIYDEGNVDLLDNERVGEKGYRLKFEAANYILAAVAVENARIIKEDNRSYACFD